MPVIYTIDQNMTLCFCVLEPNSNPSLETLSCVLTKKTIIKRPNQHSLFQHSGLKKNIPFNFQFLIRFIFFGLLFFSTILFTHMN